MRSMRILILCLLVACGGSKPAADNDDTLPDPGTSSPGVDDGTAEPPRTELQRRQDAACERVIPRLTECAIEDARKNMSPEEFAKLEPDKVGPVHTRENLKKCKESYMSSRQVRVYEVCDREETECGPLVACLENAKPKDQ